MNKEITMYELLGLIKESKVPRLIKFEENIYEFNGNNYINHCTYLFEKVCTQYNHISLPDVKVEILDEENDEFEDIEETDDIPNDITVSNYMIKQINKLIRNQKKIIERLKRDE